MAALRCEGKVRHLAVTSAAPRVLSALERIAPVTSVQAPYSLLQRDIEHDLLPYCAERRLAVLAASPMASGLLTGTLTPARMRSLPCNDWRRRSPSFGSDLLARAERVVDRLREVGERNGLAPGAMAIAWTLSQPAITAAIAGARRPAQVVEIAAAATSRPGDEDLADVARVLAYTGAHPHQPASPG